MKISSNILKSLIDIPEDILEITNKHIIEVDDHYPLINSTPLVVGLVVECVNHENSDHLHVTKVDVGDGEVLQIVCGAPNVAKDQHVIVAKVGSVLPGDFQIKHAKIRGVESSGMICSLAELGLSDKYLSNDEKEGIYVFKQAVNVGDDALKALNLDGYTIELGLTPNRGDLLSVIGYAKDLSAVKNIALKQTNYEVKEGNFKTSFDVKINTPNGYLYEVREFRNLEVKESPWWLKASLLESGIVPINNVVDISNYILMLYGQPLHTFDLDKLSGKTISVTESKGEKVVALDLEEYQLLSGDITIRDEDKAVAIAGVMGLANSMITNDTKNVLLELAIFDQTAVKNTSTRLNLRSDSSLRYERGIDHTNVNMAMNHASYLLQTIAQASVSANVNSKANNDFSSVKVKTKVSTINKKLGTSLSKDEVLDYLKRLSFIIKDNKDELEVVVPANRFDIKIEADIIEEVGRMYGLDDITNLKLLHDSRGGLSYEQLKLRKLRHFVSNLGFNETINYSLVSEAFLSLFPSGDKPIKLLKPLSSDRSHLRQDLASSLISTAIYNNSRQIEDLSIFEIGKVFNDEERLKLGLLTTGEIISHKLNKMSLKSTFYVLKGLLSNIADHLSVKLTYKPNTRNHFHPYAYADIYHGDKLIGYIGQVHPKVAKNNDLKETFLAQLDLTYLLSLKPLFTYQPVSKFPTIIRDLAIVVSEDVLSSAMTDLITQTLKSVLVDVVVFDVYQGTNIKEGFKSVALRMILNDKDKTLETKDIDALVKRVVKRLEYELKAEIRTE